MAFYKNQQLYVLNDSNQNVPFYTIKDEIFLTSDLSATEIFNYTENGYINALKAPVAMSIIRVYLLNKDETIYQDISEYVMNDWSISFQKKNGGIRSGNITLINIDNKWSFHPVNGTIWKGTKLKIQVGIYNNSTIYWKDCGIFVCGKPSVDMDLKKISLPLNDKFAMIDGTIGGKRANQFKIPVGTNVKTAIELCLSADKGNGDVFDSKSIIFPIEYLAEVTPYTITKEQNCTIGDLVIELAEKILNCNVSYNNNGNLVITKGIVTNNDYKNCPINWYYIENEQQYSDLHMDIDWDSLINEIIVAGTIVNGAQFKYILTNVSPSSQANIYLTEPTPLYIEDNQLNSNDLCRYRAEYEMIKQGRIAIQAKMNSVFIPHLDVDSIISLTDYSNLNLINELFIVNSISISSNLTMSVSMANINEVVF